MTDAPQPQRWPYLDHEGPIAFAHRGGAGHRWENTMAAFQRAVDLGYRYIETDVHATSDGVLLAFHDRRLHRMTGQPGRVRDIPYTHLAQATVRGREPLPTLAEVLTTWPDLRLNVDVKDAPAIGPLLDVLRRTKAIDRVCVASFSDARVRAVREAMGPRLATALAPREVAALRVAALAPSGRLDHLVPRGVPCAQVPLGVRGVRIVDHRFLATAHRLGISVHIWVIDDAGVMTRLLDDGVDGIMTDDLEALRGVLAGRGHWPPR